MKRLIMYAAVMMLLLPVTSNADKLKLSFDHYYDHDAVVQALKDINSAYSNMTELRSIGQSEEGREIWMLQINNPKTGPDLDKPAVYVEGTIHGNEIQATEVCLYLAWYLLDNYGSVEDVTELVDTRAFYIVPIVNVDNRARFFEDPSNYNIGRSAIVGYDDDRDGLVDEDDYDDLDEDGEIVQMRIKDPGGEWKTHPDDPRVMVRVEDGERGEYRLLGMEGIDNDDDGNLNEDTPGYLDMNRNYGFMWQPPYVQSGAGDFPMSAKPTKAVADFLITKPNIAFAFSYHNSGGMILRGPASKLIPMYMPQDISVYDYLGFEGERIIPNYRYLITVDDLYTCHGDFTEFLYSNLGIFSFVGELFMSIQEQFRKPGEEGYSDEERYSYFGGVPSEERQKFNDRLAHGTMFKEWEEFDHPQFGKIELGGWKAFTTRIPQKFQLLDLVHRNASHVIFVAQHTPEVELEVLEIKSLGDGLNRIRIRAWNDNAIPSLSHVAMNKDIVRPDIFSIKGSGIEVVSGGIVQDIHYDRVRFVEHRPHMVFTSVPSFGYRDIQWIVRGNGKVTISYDAKKAANRELSVNL